MAGRSSSVLPSCARPAEPIRIYEYEPSPYSRKVREACSMLDLEVTYLPCPGARTGFAAELGELGGKMQVCLIIKEAFAVESGGAAAAATAAAVELPNDATEVEILTRFFMDSKGPEWKNKEKWCDPEAPVEEWFGVGVAAADGCVTSLSLPHNGITFVSAVVNRLTRLQTVNLQENSTLDAKSIADVIKANE